MPQADINKRLGFVLHDVARLWRWRFERLAKSEGLTRSQWSVLAQLKRKPGLKQSALAQILEIKPITLARFIDKLEKAGWVDRRPDPKDRRANRLYLTRKAAPVLARMFKIGQETRRAAMEGLGGKDEAKLLEMLLRIRENLVRASAEEKGE
ncbi:MAG TPA: MarR family transcriptional regulator [Alphaproteobacteria bacterium]|nr:MarR family transcriptional regulator [Alphaproteobacteria bacterium]